MVGGWSMVINEGSGIFPYSVVRTSVAVCKQVGGLMCALTLAFRQSFLSQETGIGKTKKTSHATV